MENDTTTLEKEVTQNNGEKTLENNQGTQTIQPQVDKKNEGKTYSEEEFNTATANTRRATERETKKKLLAELGLSLDDEEKLAKYKQAYEDSLSDEEKRNTEMQTLQTENTKLSKDLEEKEYTIKALIELTGKNENDVGKIVKMAKGLKTEENTIEEAIKEVISMVNIEKPIISATTVVQSNPNMPVGQELEQPSVVSIDTQDNPFKAGNINLTKQGQLIKENPELAKKLASEAGIKLKF